MNAIIVVLTGNTLANTITRITNMSVVVIVIVAGVGVVVRTAVIVMSSLAHSVSICKGS